MIDSHCHLDMPRFDLDRDDVIARARAAGVAAMVIPGVEPDRWAKRSRCRGSDLSRWGSIRR